MRHWRRRRLHAIGRTPPFGICGNLRNLCTNTRPRTSRDEVGNHGPHAVYLARRCQAVGFSTECQKMTLRTDADSDSEVSGPKSPDSPSPVWAMPPPRGRLEAWCSGHSLLCQCVPRLADAEPPDSESPATSRSVRKTAEWKQRCSAPTRRTFDVSGESDRQLAPAQRMNRTRSSSFLVACCSPVQSSFSG